MSRKSACYPRWMVVLIGLSLFAGPALGQVYQYRAQLRAAAIQQGQVSASGIVWNCAGAVCQTSGPWPTPGLGACQTLAAKVGAVASYGHPGASLSPGQLSQCNQGLASPQLAGPMTKAAPMVSIKPMLQTKTVSLPAGTASTVTPAQIQQKTLLFNQLSNQRAQVTLQAQKPIPMMDAGNPRLRAIVSQVKMPPCGVDDCDGDGRLSIASGGDDCDDNNVQRFPGHTEVCDSNDHDEDCDPATFGFRDTDADGHVDLNCGNIDLSNGGQRKSGNDCDDMRRNVNPDAADICDGLDNNCDGIVDENQTLTFFLDADGDGHGSPDNRVSACPYDQSAAAATGRWLVMVGNDCDDSNPDLWHDCP